MLSVLENNPIYSFVNCLGDAYFVHQRGEAHSRRYFMSKSKDGALQELPHGYSVQENIKGRVSIAMSSSVLITGLESNLVQTALRQLRQSCYKADIRGRRITIYASAADSHTHAQSIDAEFTEGFATTLEEIFARKYGHELAALFRSRRSACAGASARREYYPLLRFSLKNKTTRWFSVQRIYFSGNQDWFRIEELPLSAAVMKYIPHLGKDSFFDLL